VRIGAVIPQISLGDIDQVEQQFDWRACLLHTLAWQIVGLLGLAAHVALIATAGPLAFPIWIGLLALLFVHLPLAGFVVFLQFLLYQNWFISLFSPEIHGGSFQALQGTAFAAAAALALVSGFRIWTVPERGRAVRTTAFWIGVALALVAVYTALGAVTASPASALVYFRNTSGALIALLIALDLGRHHGIRTVASAFVLSVLLGMTMTACEYLWPLAYYETINAARFMNLKFPAEVYLNAREVLEYRTRSFFNMGEGAADAFRFGGTNMHPISYGYVMGAAAIAAAVLRRWFFVLVALVPIVLASVKGALIMIVAALLIQLVWAVTRSARLTLLAALGFTALYLSVGIYQGLKTGDYHVIGFMGGVRGFLANPIGHGIGAGGNHSENWKDGFDWHEFQNSGATFALESAIGVLMYQMGIAMAAVLWVYGKVIYEGWWRRRMEGPRVEHLIYAALAVVIVNGVFQEEAFSPYALGLIAPLAGVSLASSAATVPSGRDRRMTAAPNEGWTLGWETRR
jgi:hypothetical protein